MTIQPYQIITIKVFTTFKTPSTLLLSTQTSPISTATTQTHALQQKRQPTELIAIVRILKPQEKHGVQTSQHLRSERLLRAGAFLYCQLQYQQLFLI